VGDRYLVVSRPLKIVDTAKTTTNPPVNALTRQVEDAPSESADITDEDDEVRVPIQVK